MDNSGDYISRKTAVELLSQPITMSMCLSVEECHHKIAQQRIDRYLVENIPAADVPPALWTDEPISGTEFMTHSQGQGGFEIHFRTDDKAKYEAVQDECRRQIDHAKPAADVRPVVRAHFNDDWETGCSTCSACGDGFLWEDFNGVGDWHFCPNCGADMREES